MKGIIPHNPELQREAEVHTKTIYFANGDILQEAFGGSWDQEANHPMGEPARFNARHFRQGAAVYFEAGATD